MPLLGGNLYNGVFEGLDKLSQKYRLFILSNCSASGLKNFMDFTGTKDFITDTITFGETNKPKSVNMKYLIDKHNLKSPIYIGDTQGDCDETHKAVLPFGFVTYGFGECHNPDIVFDDFNKLVDYFLK